MSKYLVVAALRNDCFLGWGLNMVSEYPDAKLFRTFTDAAKAAVDVGLKHYAIYTDKGYQEGTGPHAQVDVRTGAEVSAEQAPVHRFASNDPEGNAEPAHYCRCCGEETSTGKDCCSDDFPEPGDLREWS
jgi:hypothetical protein